MNQEKSMAQSGKVRSAAAWAAKLGEVLAEITGSRPTVRQIPFDESEALADLIWWRSAGSPAVCIGVSETDAASLLRLRAHNLPGEPSDPARANLSDVLDRSWGNGAQTGGEIMAQAPADAESREICKAEFASGESVRFIVFQSEPAPHGGANLEMLMDIELPVTFRFGSTRMALRDITGLTTGSVIEFDRGVDEPVEVMVNGRVVALGEAVAVRGSYGVRISEISSRQERLMTSSFAAAQDTHGAGEEIA